MQLFYHNALVVEKDTIKNMLNISNLNNKICKFQNICYISTIPRNLFSWPLPWQNQTCPKDIFTLS